MRIRAPSDDRPQVNDDMSQWRPPIRGAPGGKPIAVARLTAGFRKQTSKLGARRCSSCGFVEFYVEARSKPVKTLRSVDEENERLRRLVAKLQQRVEALQTIATDPAERTAREIESLRALPRIDDTNR